MSAPGSGEQTGLLLVRVLHYLYRLPRVRHHVVGVDIIQPLEPVIAPEIVDLVVYEAAGGRDPGAGLLPVDLGSVPLHGGRVQAPDVVQLSELVGLTAEYEDLGLEGNCGVLEAAAGTDGRREVGRVAVVAHERVTVNVGMGMGVGIGIAGIVADGHLHHHVRLVILS